MLGSKSGATRVSWRVGNGRAYRVPCATGSPAAGPQASASIAELRSRMTLEASSATGCISLYHIGLCCVKGYRVLLAITRAARSVLRMPCVGRFTPRRRERGAATSARQRLRGHTRHISKQPCLLIASLQTSRDRLPRRHPPPSSEKSPGCCYPPGTHRAASWFPPLTPVWSGRPNRPQEGRR